MERGFLGQLGFCVGSHAECDRLAEVVMRRIDAQMDIRGLPAIGRADVIRAGRGRADQVGHRPQQHIVARPRPGLVEDEGIMGVDARIVEEIDRRPAAARRDAEGCSAAFMFSVQFTWPG